MTTEYILEIVERFSMIATKHNPDEKWWLDWAVAAPGGAGKHLTASWLAMNSLKEVYREADDIQSCYEYFGGVGAQGLMAERLFNIKGRHQINEWSMDAITHLQSVFQQGVRIAHQDAYADSTQSEGHDLVLVDCGDLTAWKTREGEKPRALLDKVFSGNPRAVLLTDIACRYLHLQRDRYETLLGEGSCVDYYTYLHAFLDRLDDLYGYELHEGYYDRWSAVMALVPSDIAQNDATFMKHDRLKPTPDKPVGLSVL